MAGAVTASVVASAIIGDEKKQGALTLTEGEG